MKANDQKLSQGRRLIAVLKRRPMTYMQMLALGVSTSPWRRVAEGLYAGEVIRKRVGSDGLVRWSVGKA